MNDELHSDELGSLNKKREILERLLAFTQQLNELAGSLDLIKEISKPSQQFNQRIFKVLVELAKRLEVAPTSVLKARLKEIDSEVQHEIKRMLILSSMSEADFANHFKQHFGKSLKKSVELLLKEITEFQRKAQINLAIRHVLSKRGALLEPCTLPISQEKIGQNLEALRAKKAQCKSQVAHKIQELIEDTDLMLAKSKFPEELKAQLIVVRENLSTQLEKLKSGAPIEDIVYAIDTFNIGEENADTANAHQERPKADSDVASKPDHSPAAEQLTDEESLPEDHSPVKKPRSYFIQLLLDFGVWLVAPWRVSWRTIRARSRYKVNQYKQR